MREDSRFIKCWRPMIIIACLISSHFYASASFFALQKDKDDTSRSTVLYIFDHIFFAIFTLDIFINFITEYRDIGETIPCRDLEKISKRYIRGSFVVDMIAWIPLHYFIA